jgi:hypothetical protein
VTPATRRALEARIDWRAPPQPLAFEPAAFATLKAICARLIPMEDGPSFDLAGRLDQRRANGGGDGWRYDALPPDAAALRLGVAGISETARILFAEAFCDLAPERQDEVLRSVQKGSPPGETWNTLNASLFFAELLAEVATIYYSQPSVQLLLGYVGMADAKGFYALGLNQRDPVEDEGAHAEV